MQMRSRSDLEKQMEIYSVNPMQTATKIGTAKEKPMRSRLGK